ncbi:MAG TPA: phosphoenolpyruvate carboxykinase (GTP) [Planctomycetota bacterium]|nr:phosphoenolpyruvate carboxykinase (GTP) [Planctomycetota bacterium]
MSPPPVHNSVTEWVDECTRLTQPDRVHWCDGSEEEYRRLVAEMLQDGTLLELDPQKNPGSYLHRSHPSDVARSEQLTFICTEDREDAGPTNNWMSPAQALEKLTPLFRSSMKGRTLYVVPYLMGPVGSKYSRMGIEITDSAYVAANLRIMTRMGTVALEHLGGSGDFVKGLHSLGDLSPERRFVCHFPERRLIWSIGSGYGGNALLPKKCFALRIGSWLARQQGWLAEHMLILGLEDPEGKVTYMAAAFPSACGKTNLAMLVPPASQKGWKVWTVGDDIAWMHFGEDGRLYAVNPEAGFFAVAPGTSLRTNPNMMATVSRNTIYTNVALKPDRTPWWEGMDGPAPAQADDWLGKPWTPGAGTKAAHPNSRFTTPARQCPAISPRFDDPQGVPISAILFGGRRARVAPLVFEAFDWRHGVFLGATMASETTAASTGQVGVVRRDPMAMLPFCGYNMADYFGHWLRIGAKSDEAPGIFHVNWFQTDSDGSFLWPGFGENLRVLRWILDRVRGKAEAVRTPIGFLPTRESLDLSGLNLPESALRRLLSADRDAWIQELADMKAFFEKFGRRLPEELWQEHDRLMHRLNLEAA